MVKKEKINNLLKRGVVEVIDKKNLERKLLSGKKLRVKLGIDPTGYDLHIGHAVPLRKLKAFQDLGHQAVLIIGDYTARIGDPSGLDKTRPQLSLKEVKKYAQDYINQASLVLDIKKTEVRWQSEWFKKFDLEKIINLTAKATLAQVLSHETFRQRLEKGQPLATHEILYPFLQGYDSVAVKADVELGAMEQKFNLLMGRTIQEAFQQEPQDILMTPYLIGTDGRKMSKSFENYIALKDSPGDMYGKVMSIPDELIIEYFTLATEIPLKEIERIRGLLKKGENPRDYKAKLARKIVSLYYGEKAAKKAEEEFNRVFKEKELPDNIPSFKPKKYTYLPIDLLVEAKLVNSRSEARRLIEQKAVSLNGSKIENWQKEINLAKGDVLKVGKRRFIKII